MESWQQMLTRLASGRMAALKRHAFLLCGDESLAEDLVQEALVRAFSRPLGVPRVGTAEAYVRVIIVNLFVDHARRRSRWTRAAPLLMQAEMAPDIAEHVVIRDAVLTAMNGLSPRQRACVVLRYYEDMPIAQVAKVLGVRAGTVARYLNEAMTRLGELMSGAECG